MECPNCKRNIPNDSKICCYCGQRIEEGGRVMKCSNPQCGKEIPSDSQFCPFCGTIVSSTSSVDAIQDKLTFEVNGVSFNMIRVEHGNSILGDNDDNASYYIGETQVTQRLWKAVIKTNPSRLKGDNLPVEQVSWDDCQEFIKKLNKETDKKFRLPTEAEWEYAAYGGNKSNGYNYSGSNDIDNVAWYYENSFGKTHNVKEKVPNELGIYGMNGNVWEWCQNVFSTRASFRVNRGGSWNSHKEQCSLFFRSYDLPNYRSSTIGFRLVLSE